MIASMLEKIVDFVLESDSDTFLKGMLEKAHQTATIKKESKTALD